MMVEVKGGHVQKWSSSSWVLTREDKYMIRNMANNYTQNINFYLRPKHFCLTHSAKKKIRFILFFFFIKGVVCAYDHGLWTLNEGINQRCLKNWADVADKICVGRT